MDIWPAIDLRGGKCVRLRQGDFSAETVYGDDPVAMARHWQSQGAERLHVVDLDGARTGSGRNRAVIESIISATGLTVQVGGGVRDDAAVESLLGAGAARVIIGTRAVEAPDWFSELARQHPQRIILGLDAKDGLVAVAGWETVSSQTIDDVVNRYADLPLAAVVYTDISRDGMLSGPNIAAMAEMVSRSPWPVIASGGIGSTSDVAELCGTGVAGCIVGKALYDGAVKLPDLLEFAATTS